MLKLDVKPVDWEERTALFCAYLVEKGNKSATIKSYVSAIKNILVTDGYKWNDSLILMDSPTKACRLANDKIYLRFPIHIGLLEMLLFELERLFSMDWYLEVMYKALFSLAYYGMMRVGELAHNQNESISNHAVKACNVHIGLNKKKILLILYSSKTHDKSSRPQRIKIQAKGTCDSSKLRTCKNEMKRHFCPFQLLKNYMNIRGAYEVESEQLFVFKQKIPVAPRHIRKVLKTLISRVGLDASLYDVHSLRSGRTTDLIKAGYSVDEVKRMGRWKSNAVYKYIKC